MREHMRTWEESPFRLETFDIGKSRDGKWAVEYEFYCEDRSIFSGGDFYCSPMHAVDSDESTAGILSFLSLRPGDVDREYFDDYTEDQMAFTIEYGERLGYLALELECGWNRCPQCDEMMREDCQGKKRCRACHPCDYCKDC